MSHLNPLIMLKVTRVSFVMILLSSISTIEGILAQESYTISGGDISVCEGYFIDDGTDINPTDPNGAPYSDQNYTITICPDVPGDAIQVNFIAFDLQTNANPDNNDYLVVYDGDNTGAPAVGVGTGNSFQGVSITGSVDNPSGCLTFSFFVLNGASGGDIGWLAEMACVTPCTYPSSGYDLTDPEPFDNNSPSVGLCPGQEITFDGSSSIPDAEPLEYWIWNWGDGIVDSTETATGVHSYDEPGEYLVSLVVSDENSCTSVNFEVYQVLVSTIPIFNADYSSPLCAGSPGYLDGNPVQSITWTALPPLAVSENADLPDNTGIPFVSELPIDFFDDGQVLEECDDIELITANIEHSFIGDLTMSVICPDGTEVILMENGPSGAADPNGCTPNDVGGNDLGIVDVEGFDYSWDMDAEWVLDDANNPDIANPVPAGTYLPCGDLCDFVGCPLNGIWTFVIIDQWTADNGTLFEWSIDFNPEIVPGITTFTPTIGAGVDSSYWQVNSGTYGVQAIDPLSDYVNLEFDEPGVYDFTYTVTNSFSCSWDTTVVIDVVENPGNSITAGPDQIFCGDPVQLQGAFLGDGISPCAGSAETVVHCYDNNENTSWTYCPDTPGDGTMMEILFYAGQIEGFFDHIQIFDGVDNTAPLLLDLSGAYPESFVAATNPDGCLYIQFTSDGSISCGSGNYDPVSWCAGCGQDACGFMWNWVPADNLTNANSANPIVETFDGFPTEYVAFVEPIGLENCATTDTVLVVPGFIFTTSFSDPTCVLTDGTIAIEIDEPPSEGPWTIELFENGTSVETVISNGGVDVFDNLTEGNYSVELSDAIGCEYTVPFVLSPPQPMDFDLTPNPNICINGVATLETSSDMDPGQVWTYSWDNGLGTGDVQVVNPIVDTDYTVFATDANGCTSDAQTVTVQVYDSLNVSISAPDLICGGAFAELEADIFNGGSGAGYSFNWSWQNNPVGGDESYWVDYPQATGTYCVTLNDNCETPSATACEEVVIETPIPAAFTSDTTRSCVPGVFQFESLVDPALIAQTEWFFGDGELSYEASPAHAYLSPGSYDITFNITSLVGCEYVNFQPNYLQVFTPPYVGFTASPQPTRVPDTEVQFESVNSTNVVDWFWLFDSIQYLGASNESNPLFEFPIDQGGNYPVTLVVTDENGCSSQITRTIEVLDLFSLYIPTAFSPNNDGTNDAFFAVGTDIDPARFSMQVINRWGNLVFETTDVNEVWYGKSNDASEHFAQDGVYFYRVVVYSLSNPAERKEIKGAVTLMR